jgi:hypothetical protein
MDRFIDYMTTKAGMAEALRSVIAAGGNPYSESRARLGAAIEALIDPCAAAGVTRGNVNADDVLMTLSGVALAAGGIDQREQAGRMLNFLMDGLRYSTRPPQVPQHQNPHICPVLGELEPAKPGRSGQARS